MKKFECDKSKQSSELETLFLINHKNKVFRGSLNSHIPNSTTTSTKLNFEGNQNSPGQTVILHKFLIVKQAAQEVTKSLLLLLACRPTYFS